MATPANCKFPLVCNKVAGKDGYCPRHSALIAHYGSVEEVEEMELEEGEENDNE